MAKITLYSSSIDGERLVHFKRSHEGRFVSLVDAYRKAGFRDAEIAQAMADARNMISTLRLRGGR